MPFDPTISKAIQVRKATDDKLSQVIKLVEKKDDIKLRSRDQVIDMLATRYLKEQLDD